MESLVGRTLGKCELTAMIGGGGMATVYKARHPGLDQQVAVKILHPFLASDPSFVDRFRREARAVAALRHPNIVRVLDSDHEDHLYYMVMEYIGGPTLSAVLSTRRTGGGLSLPEVGRIFSPLCDAIDYAAARGMVHRDIKPANIIMSEDGEPILTDYGIAKMIGSTSLTSPGTVVGSAHYMSPEQAQGQECDVRSDLYSLGVVLFECLAGVVPFDGDTTATVLVKHISAPPPSIRSLRPNLPPAIEPVLERALAKLPRDRYEMGAVFAEELTLALAPTKSTPVVTELVTPAHAAKPVPPTGEHPPAEPPSTVAPAAPPAAAVLPTESPMVESPPAAAPHVPPPPPPPSDVTRPEPVTPAEGVTPIVQQGPIVPEALAVTYPQTADAAQMHGWVPPRRRNRRRLLVIAGLALVLVAGAGTAAALALRDEPVVPENFVTTTDTTSLLTTSTLPTSTTLMPTSTTATATTTTLRPTTTTVKATTTTARATTTVRRTTTTKKPTTTQTTSPPGTIGPGTTSPPGTIGPG